MTLTQGQLDQAKVSVTDFRTETATLNAREKMKLRKMFHDIGIDCKPNEETTKAGEYLARLVDLADHIGGDAPMPERPKTEHIDSLRSLAGNEQLTEILKQYDTLDKQSNTWEKLSDLAGKRKPAWETLCTLIRHADTIPEVDELRAQVEAVKSERRLLEASDPVPDIRKAAVDTLRTAVTAAHSEFVRTYKELMAALTASDNWKKINAAQQKKILADEDIADLSALSVGSEADLIRTLDLTSLPAWKTQTDALIQQFDRAAIVAARRLEPKTQRVHLSSGILQSEDEVKEWLAKQERDLLVKVMESPIVIA